MISESFIFILFKSEEMGRIMPFTTIIILQPKRNT